MGQNSCKTGQKVQSSVFCGKLVVTAMNVLYDGRLADTVHFTRLLTETNRRKLTMFKDLFPLCDI